MIIKSQLGTLLSSNTKGRINQCLLIETAFIHTCDSSG
jgi:hypothetical protein